LLDQSEHRIGDVRGPLVGKIHPRAEPDVDAARDDPEVDIERRHPAACQRRRAGLDGLEAVDAGVDVRAGVTPGAKVRVDGFA